MWNRFLETVGLRKPQPVVHLPPQPVEVVEPPKRIPPTLTQVIGRKLTLDELAAQGIPSQPRAMRLPLPATQPAQSDPDSSLLPDPQHEYKLEVNPRVVESAVKPYKPSLIPPRPPRGGKTGN